MVWTMYTPVDSKISQIPNMACGDEIKATPSLGVTHTYQDSLADSHFEDKGTWR